MRGIPRVLGTMQDVINLARDLPITQAAAFVEGIDDSTWQRLGADADTQGEIRLIIAERLAIEDKQTRITRAKSAALAGQIAARSDADAIARDARRIKEELDDTRAHRDDLRADGAGEGDLKSLSARLVELESMFAAAMTRHMALIGTLTRLRKKAKDEEEV